MIDKNSNTTTNQQPTCKKIQNYIFKFSDLLGQGNFSKVYKAHHEITDQVVAIKIVELNSLKSKKLQELLFSQINVLKKLNHPNILRCYEVFTSNRNCYIITQLCNEGDLESKLRRRQYFTEEAAEPIIRDIFQGLLYLAQQNVIHRDLKVANVFLHNGKAKIADFGFAKFTQSKFKDISIGSPIYMSPQGFIENIYGPKTDIWAFGVLIYELLHGVTPFNYCKTEAQLKYNLSLPLSKNRIKSEISYELQQVMLQCMENNEQKRKNAFELSKLPYFERILKKSALKGNYYSEQFQQSSKQQYRVKPSQYQHKQAYSSKTSNNIPESNSFQNRRISFDRNPRQNNMIPHQSGSSFDRGISPLNGFRNEKGQNDSKKQSFLSTKHMDISHNSKNEHQGVQQSRQPRQRLMTTQKRRISTHHHDNKSIEKRDGLHLVSNNRLPKIISQKLTFKQTVNLLHYGRLIFKFLTFLKEQENWQVTYKEEIEVLTKWLFVLLDQVAQKIQAKEILFEGGSSPEMREKKLVEVTTEYQKKYRKQLQSQLIEVNRKEKLSLLNLDYMKDFLYNQYLKYDKVMSSTNQMNKNLLYLCHNIMMIYETTRLLKKCYDQRNYVLFQNYKDIELFLSKSKETMDAESYKNKRKGMTIYA